ncbi:MAG: OmpA family protein [Deltaproteobacteria bacterium]|nr:OmpA family protein [Deltaproteobacteria bacterium]
MTPITFAVIVGYTDSIGSAGYNIGLSRTRAESVAQYLESKFNISPDSLLGDGRLGDGY